LVLFNCLNILYDIRTGINESNTWMDGLRKTVKFKTIMS
jgi:hypothetical protein